MRETLTRQQLPSQGVAAPGVLGDQLVDFRNWPNFCRRKLVFLVHGAKSALVVVLGHDQQWMERRSHVCARTVSVGRAHYNGE